MSTTEHDITPEEFRRAVKQFKSEIGPKAEIIVGLNDHVPDGASVTVWTTNFRAAVYVNGMVDECTFKEGHDTLKGLLTAVQNKWQTCKHQFELQTVRSMALAIIRITSELGCCTDAALRAEFTGDVVEPLGARACAHADDMAGRGPFTITTIGGANAPEAEAA